MTTRKPRKKAVMSDRKRMEGALKRFQKLEDRYLDLNEVEKADAVNTCYFILEQWKNKK